LGKGVKGSVGFPKISYFKGLFKGLATEKGFRRFWKTGGKGLGNYSRGFWGGLPTENFSIRI